VRAAATAPHYRLYALPGGERPGLVRADDGAAIAVEVWRLAPAGLGLLLTQVPPPLAIGTVELAGGVTVRGFLCEVHATAGAEDITSYGGWRSYLGLRAALA
jgi:allophanate hydrolase